MYPKPNLEEIRKKTQELCQLILDQEAFPQLRAMVTNLSGNQEALSLYNDVLEQQRVLQQKQQQGLQLTTEEINAFNKARDKIYANPVSRDFLYASEELDKIQDLVLKYVLKTIELERIPTEADFDEGCDCGGSCSCGGH